MSDNTLFNATNVSTETVFTVNNNKQIKLAPADGAANDQFGYSVAISSDGNTAIIGAIYDDDKGIDSGSAYIYVRNDGVWSQQFKIVPADGAAGDSFGCSVAISGDGNTAIIGANCDNDNGNYSGSAYIYIRNNNVWLQQIKLVPEDGATGDSFGISVAISADGNTAIVGSVYNVDDKGNESGSVYIYTRDNGVWSQQAKLLAADKAAYDHFGYSVAISGDGSTVIIGAHGNDKDINKGIDIGSVYIYTRNNGVWSQQAKLVPEDGASYDHFGYSVAISDDGNTIIIGAIGDDDKGTNSGSVYIYTRNDGIWSQQAKLVPADGASSDSFGYSVAISGDGNKAVIGAVWDNIRGIDSGSAYIYSRNSNVWSQQAKLIPADGASYDHFGYSVAISSDGNTAIIGAHLDDNNGIDSGSAYIFV